MKGLITFLGLAIAQALWSGLVLVVLWGWFAVPVFGLPALSIPAAVGMILIVSLLTARYNPTPDGHEVRAILFDFYYPAVMLGVGFVAKLIMG